MRRWIRFAVMVMFGLLAGQARAGIDLTMDHFSGLMSVHVGYNPGSLTSNFTTGPVVTNQATAYDVYISSDANNVYFRLQADPSEEKDGTQGRAGASYPDFANLYLSTTGTGTNIGVEVSTVGTPHITDAFVPGGQSGYQIPAGDSAVTFTQGTYSPSNLTGTGDTIDVGIAWSFFTTNPDKIPNFSALQPGGKFQIRDSQSFGYTYSANNFNTIRLGQVTYEAAVATPEPATWAEGILAAAAATGIVWRRRRVVGA